MGIAATTRYLPILMTVVPLFIVATPSRETRTHQYNTKRENTLYLISASRGGKRDVPGLRGRGNIVEHDDYEEAWKLAFGAAILELHTPDSVTVRDVYQALWAERNDTRAQVKALLQLLGTEGWHWGAFKEQCTTRAQYKAMATALALNVTSAAYGLFRRTQLAALVKVRPYWQFRATDGISPPECIELDGSVYHYTDSFWQKHLPPCGRVRCVCNVHGLNERDVAKLTGKTPNQSMQRTRFPRR